MRIQNFGYNYGGSDFNDFGYYDYTTSPGGDTVASVLIGIITTLGAFFLLYFLYRLICYILGSVGRYHLAKDRGIAHAWFSWIPFLSYYIEGRLINDKVVLGDSIVLKHAEFFLPFLSFLSFSATAAAVSSSSIGVVASVFATAVWVYQISALWRLFKIYRPKSRTSFTIWSAILSPGIFIFIIRNDRPFDPLEPDKRYENFYAEKKVVQDRYDNIENQIRSEEERERVQLRDSYERQMNQPGLTEDQRDDLKDRYHADLNRIENIADGQINAQKQRERQDIYELDRNKPQEVDETDVYQQNRVSNPATPTFQEVDLEQTVKVDESGVQMGRTVSLKDENSISQDEIDAILRYQNQADNYPDDDE